MYQNEHVYIIYAEIHKYFILVYELFESHSSRIYVHTCVFGRN